MVIVLLSTRGDLQLRCLSLSPPQQLSLARFLRSWRRSFDLSAAPLLRIRSSSRRHTVSRTVGVSSSGSTSSAVKSFHLSLALLVVPITDPNVPISYDFLCKVEAFALELRRSTSWPLALNWARSSAASFRRDSVGSVRRSSGG